MGSPCDASEIVESNEEPNLFYHSDETNARCLKLKADDRDGNSRDFPFEGDTNQIDLGTSSMVGGGSRQMGIDIGRKCILKKPVKGGISPSSEIGISESVTLKQALRKLCISQASEMAAMKKISKPIGLSGTEAETIKKLYASVVVQTNEERRNLVEISFMPEKITPDSSEKAAELCHLQNLESTNKVVVTSHCTVPNKTGVAKTRIQDVITSTDTEDDTPNAKIGTNGKLVSKTLLSNFKTTADSGKSTSSPRLMKPALRDKACVKKKGKRDPTSATNGSSKCVEVSKVGAVPTKMKLASNSTNLSGKFGTRNKDSSGTATNLTPNSKCGNKMNGVSRSKEKGECSQSSKSSIGDYSCSTSISEESHQSGSSGNCSRPHMSRDVRWIAIRKIVTQHGSLGLDDFKLLKRLGCGDIGTVYLAELIGSDCLFALKVMDNEYLVSRKKMLRSQTEREILQMLDHPFLPTLYAHFTTDNLSCLVMEYCPGGDLHVLRQKQPCRSFSEPAARFYVAEVLLALEYLHMLGVVYRDLKPENILVREDGHVMLTDFDLSLRCMVNPMLVSSSSLLTPEPSSKKQSGPCAENSCIEPLCLQPSWVNVSCFTPHSAEKTRKLKPDQAGQVSPLPQLVVEPVEARSNSFVGTHEYLAPEIIRGDGHGSAVDWWTFGIFLYELLFGRTPFKGPGNEETLSNVVSQSLKFPDCPEVSFDARELIRGLLTKEPENRLGSVRGAAEIKQHPFFEGLNWALIRCAAPPETPKHEDVGTPMSAFKKKEKGKCLDFRTNGEHVEFELF